MELLSTTAAVLEHHYPGFRPTRPPTGAQRAWHGILRPLPQDDELIPVLADLESDCRVYVLGDGMLQHDPACRRNHNEPWYAKRLQAGQHEFSILLADLGPNRHPQVFSIKPTISGTVFPNHPHLRRDLLSCHNGTPLHALCTYLSTDGVNPVDDMTLVRALDFASIFLAKHVVWTRTGTLNAYEQGKPPRVITTDNTGIGVHFRPCKTGQTEYRWEGHWPGTAAPHMPTEVLSATKPGDECPCGSRKEYGACCRNDHVHAQDLVRRRVQLAY